MRRILCFLLFACVLLSAGCVKAEGTVQQQLSDRVAAAQAKPAMQPSFSHGLYSYYKEPSIGRISSQQTSNVFRMNDAKFVMNLKVSQIINSRYYRSVQTGSLPEGMKLIAQYEGTILDYRSREHPFAIRLYELENEVYTYAESDLLEFFAISSVLEALQMAEVMTYIARCTDVDSAAVVETYSSRRNIDYSRKRLELFQNIAPENGAIEELFENHSNFAGRADNTDIFGDNYGQETAQPEPEENDPDVSSGNYETDNLDDEKPTDSITTPAPADSH